MEGFAQSNLLMRCSLSWYLMRLDKQCVGNGSVTLFTTCCAFATVGPIIGNAASIDHLPFSSGLRPLLRFSALLSPTPSSPGLV